MCLWGPLKTIKTENHCDIQLSGEFEALTSIWNWAACYAVYLHVARLAFFLFCVLSSDSGHFYLSRQSVGFSSSTAHRCQGHWAVQLPTVLWLSECWALFFCQDALEHWAQALHCSQHNSTDCQRQFLPLKTSIRQQQSHTTNATCAVKTTTTFHTNNGLTGSPKKHEAVNEEQWASIRALCRLVNAKTNSTTCRCPPCTENSPRCSSVTKTGNGKVVAPGYSSKRGRKVMLLGYPVAVFSTIHPGANKVISNWSNRQLHDALGLCVKVMSSPTVCSGKKVLRAFAVDLMRNLNTTAQTGSVSSPFTASNLHTHFPWRCAKPSLSHTSC